MAVPATSDLKDWLRKGLGRAALFVQANEWNSYRDDLLHACLTCLVHDRLLECSRSWYLLTLVRLSGKEGFYHDRILHALNTWDNSGRREDRNQLVELTRRWAEEGDIDARRLVYGTFRRETFDPEDITAPHAVAMLDGVAGLLAIMEHYQQLPVIAPLHVFSRLVSNLEDYYGKEETWAELMRTAQKRPALRALLDRIQADRQSPYQEEPRPSYAEIRNNIVTGNVHRLSSLGFWGKRATTEELHEAAADLLAETDEDRLYAYLYIFRYRAYPGTSDPLISLAHSTSDRIAKAATAALENFKDHAVRAFALKLLELPERCDEGAHLLVPNYQDGDYRLLEHYWNSPMDVERLHGFSLAVIAMFSDHPLPEAEQCLLALYERGPCTFCRSGAVQKLLALGRLPDWMRAECQYDAEQDTRELVQ